MSGKRKQPEEYTSIQLTKEAQQSLKGQLGISVNGPRRKETYEQYLRRMGII
jgi:hypothetical protein